ncbi:uncharacterized protein LOC131249199 isoform X2 [Magnolia sinica]|uniref:uncharacterized protein LOC131249199 isoform X2 n=1 Tax=Magnolia sinica TaxID=86752 RepID=UPI002659661A|nr:uncharacterized protein LOC131249199 isoform X2 [Magnolia sinica]
MANDSNLDSMLRNLSPEGEAPWLPPKPWESIASESGSISLTEEHSSSRFSDPIYDPSTVSESTLVRLVINALQGVKSALDDIEKLCEAFSSNPADRTFHRIPSLWHRSSSTNAFGKILKSIGHSGLVFFLLCKFVDYFVGANLNVGGENRDDNKKRGKETSPKFAESQSETRNGDSHHGKEMGACPRYSLVNQAFSVAVGKILEGYVCALNTLFSSVHLRHSSKNANPHQQVSPVVGCLTSIVHSEISVLEVYLHTKELRTHIQALQNICFFKNEDLASLVTSREDAVVEMTLKLRDFPRGTDLLTYLYVQLRDADPVHRALLKFLFVRSCEPYCGFIKSWIYQASICDPYKEFIIEHDGESSPSSHGKAGYRSYLSEASIKEGDGVAVPCFLQDIRLPLLRAGQQLLVLVKLLDMCNFATVAEDHSYRPGAHFSSPLSNLEDVLPYWNDPSNKPIACSSPLTFSKRNIEAMILKRETVHRMAQEKLKRLFPRLCIRCRQISSSVIPFCTFPFFLDSRRGGENIPTALISDEGLISSHSTADEEATDLAAGAEDTDASSTSDYFSSDTEQSDISEEKYKFQESTGQPDIFVVSEPGDFSASGLFSCFENRSILRKPLGSETPKGMECVHEVSCDRMDTDPHHKDVELTQFSLTLQSEASKWCRKLETSNANYLFGTCWPLGGLLKNPFSSVGGYAGETHAHLANGSQKVTDRNVEISTREDSNFGKEFGSGNSNMEPVMKKIEVNNPKYENSSTESWNLRHVNKLLSMNPMLTKNAWFHMMHDSRDKDHVASKNSSFPHFDFSSVEDPYKACGERLDANFDHGFQVEHPVSMVSGVSALEGINKDLAEQCHDDDGTPFDQIGQSVVSSPAYSSRNSKEILQEKDLSTRTSGGAKWESLLSYSSKYVVFDAGGHGDNSVAGFEIPLDVIVDKCIVQEIFLQYKYVSDFTIKLLEEGFDLQGHLSALRHYHFMELADWADSFIMSLWRHKWHVSEADQRVSEVQMFLDLALQRSSCESDQYKERLFVSMKGQGMMLPPTSAGGVHAFDFITLGYRVDWPVSIVLTADALKLYADIFSFLTQVKLAVFSLTDIWRLLKELLSRDSGLDEREMKYFNVLIKMSSF